MFNSTIRILATVLAAGTIAAAAPSVWAAPGDYRFDVAQAKKAQGNATVVAVRLIRVPDGKPVEGVVIFQTRVDMAPMGMPDMTGKVTPLPPEQPGVYRFQVELGMPGKAALTLAAKVQGEPDTVRGTVTFDAGK
jgi:YtkA-like protein